MYFKLNLLAFIVSFFIAIIISLITIPIPQIISIYPNINDNTIYYDNINKKNFKLNSIIVDCPIININ